MGLPATRPRAEIEEQLANLDREPFRELLNECLRAFPDCEDMKEFFAKYPDRAAQTITQLARLAGYTEKTEVTHNNVFLAVKAMSDSELAIRLQNMGLDMKALKTIEASDA